MSSGGACTSNSHPSPSSAVTHLFFGDRVGRIRDPLGNVWWIQARVEEVSPEEMQRRLTDPVFTEAMRYVESADPFGPGQGQGKGQRPG